MQASSSLFFSCLHVSHNRNGLKGECSRMQSRKRCVERWPVWTNCRCNPSPSNDVFLTLSPVDRWTWTRASSEPFFRNENPTWDFWLSHNIDILLQRCEVRVETRDWKPTHTSDGRALYTWIICLLHWLMHAKTWTQTDVCAAHGSRQGRCLHMASDLMNDNIPYVKCTWAECEESHGLGR